MTSFDIDIDIDGIGIDDIVVIYDVIDDDGEYCWGKLYSYLLILLHSLR
jgi:hypothetical protein